MTELRTTPSQTVGPFLSICLPWPDGPDLVAEGAPNSVTVRGRVVDGAGDPVPDALIEIWQADPDGRFPHPDDPRGAADYEGFRPFGRCPTDENGNYWFRTLKPGRVDDEQAPHIDVTVLARGLLRHLVTRIYFPDETAANESDPTLCELDEADRTLLVATPDGDGLRFDIRLQGEHETPFFLV
jgi:protocatechuate 3,4-dioxygenase alpha subunit